MDRDQIIELSLVKDRLKDKALKIRTSEPDCLGDRMLRMSMKISYAFSQCNPRPELIHEGEALLKEYEEGKKS